MPVTLAQVKTLLEAKTDWSVRAVDFIDSQLENQNWLHDWMYNASHDPCWKFTIGGEASDGDKVYLERVYKEAGWPRVVITNSSENGERPGLSTVTLYQNSIETGGTPQ